MVTIASGMLGLFKDRGFQNAEYSLNWDPNKNPIACSGTLQIKLDYGWPIGVMPLNFQMVVQQEGRRIAIMHTDPGLIIDYLAVPVETSCKTSTVSGWALAPTGTPATQLLNGYVPFVFSGVMEFNSNVDSLAAGEEPGSGSVKDWDTLVVNGVLTQRNTTGWYKVNRDCTGTMVFTMGSIQTFIWRLLFSSTVTLSSG